MESTESPLDVLSRAATMVQDSSPPDYDCARPCGTNKEVPTGRWRRDRREKLGSGYTKHRPSVHKTSERVVDTPLDMTTPRGLPPPYSQCVSRTLKSSARPSVITCAPRPKSLGSTSRREQLSDPVIDEHFRRSLGNDYKSLFNDGEEKSANGNSITVTGLSVDDHFAKALGDTWVKLQKSEPDSPTKETIAANNKDKLTTATTTTKQTSATSLLQSRRGLVTI